MTCYLFPHLGHSVCPAPAGLQGGCDGWRIHPFSIFSHTTCQHSSQDAGRGGSSPCRDSVHHLTSRRAGTQTPVYHSAVTGQQRIVSAATTASPCSATTTCAAATAGWICSKCIVCKHSQVSWGFVRYNGAGSKVVLKARGLRMML